MSKQENIRNIAIVAHVDHGKTTLVDSMLKQGGSFKVSSSDENQDRVMDSMELERERGITIAAKNCAVNFDGHKINILDTPGHADFGGEVERALNMVDGVVLLVDAAEGPLPQTRFVLGKALSENKKIILVINKIDRQDARAEEILDDVYDLFIDLGASDDQIEFPVIYAIGRDGVASTSLSEKGTDLLPLFKTIIDHMPAPRCEDVPEFKMLVSNLGYSDYLGRLAIGRVVSGIVNKSDRVSCIARDKRTQFKVASLQSYEGLGIAEKAQVLAGDIAIISGLEDIEIGDTIGSVEVETPLPRIIVDEPTISMRFSVNSSPLAGRSGKYVQSTKIGERLRKETLANVSLRVVESTEDESFTVMGRGEFQMAIIIETMRREGYELTVGRPQIIFKDIDGVRCEPIECLYVDCQEEHMGVVTEKLSRRKGQMQKMGNPYNGRVKLEFLIPSRGLIGYRNEFLTDTRGTGMMNAILHGYEPFKGEFKSRSTGSLVSDRAGQSVPYGLFHLEPRGRMFIGAGEDVYEGMIIGEHNRENDLDVNACRAKKLTNVRASGKDDAITLTPVIPLTIEKAIDFIRDDELVEVTPDNIRLRKAILAAGKRK